MQVQILNVEALSASNDSGKSLIMSKSKDKVSNKFCKAVSN